MTSMAEVRTETSDIPTILNPTCHSPSKPCKAPPQMSPIHAAVPTGFANPLPTCHRDAPPPRTRAIDVARACRRTAAHALNPHDHHLAGQDEHLRQRSAPFRGPMTSMAEVRTDTSGIPTILNPICHRPSIPCEAPPQMSARHPPSANPRPRCQPSVGQPPIRGPTTDRRTATAGLSSHDLPNTISPIRPTAPKVVKTFATSATTGGSLCRLTRTT